MTGVKDSKMRESARDLMMTSYPIPLPSPWVIPTIGFLLFCIR